MTELLKNYLGGEWTAGAGAGTPLVDPITGEELARVSSEGLDLDRGFALARSQGGEALRAMTYGERAALLAEVGKVLAAKKDEYYAIALANSGTTKGDSAVDIEGALFTLGYYAKLGAGLAGARHLLDGDAASLNKDGTFKSQHVLTPTRGVALFINAFNFPAWGLWEKAAPALLSGVPVVVKPATATAWLTQRMVADVVAAGVLPPGALSVVCGSAAGLLDRIGAFDVVSFTGSAETAAKLRGHAAFTTRGARFNVEADSINSAVLLEDAASPSAEAFDAFVSEVVREMTVKSGQKCTAIRRAFVPRARFEAAAEALVAKLAKVTVGNPRNESVRMGSLVNRAQLASVAEGVTALSRETELLFDGGKAALVDADPAVSACYAPRLLGLRTGAGEAVHEVEVFGPVATLIPYDGEDAARHAVQRGGGSLVASVYGADDARLAAFAVSLGDTHGRVHVVSPAVAKAHTGHGNVMPHSLHGGPGRAGGGEELGGLRGLGLYHRRSAVQAHAAVVDAIVAGGARG
jgi:3,4-dehydroadipyl-CoA semialdehyde dehydrogenase